MEVHVVMIVKNEADIVSETLSDACDKFDFIYVLDNGSTDGTWEIVNELETKTPSLVVAGRSEESFTRGMRGKVYNMYKANSSEGDWWGLLDSDEFYIDDPTEFLRGIPARFGWVWASRFQFYFTDVDRVSYLEDPDGWKDKPVEERLRYYINNHAEPRFVRDDGDLNWPKDEQWPLFEKPISPWLIRHKHYQYRGPEQIQHRLESRYEAIRENHNVYPHERVENWVEAVVLDEEEPAGYVDVHQESPSWEDRIVPADKLYYDDGSGEYVERPDLLPSLPEPSSQGIISRVKQKIAHYFGIRQKSCR
jgi:glycosyltransferase involved in cell wall biosynthesis